jgi:hypothetical protein
MPAEVAPTAKRAKVKGRLPGAKPAFGRLTFFESNSKGDLEFDKSLPSI